MGKTLRGNSKTWIGCIWALRVDLWGMWCAKAQGVIAFWVSRARHFFGTFRFFFWLGHTCLGLICGVCGEHRRKGSLHFGSVGQGIFFGTFRFFFWLGHTCIGLWGIKTLRGNSKT